MGETRSGETKQRYFRNRWILMSCGQPRNGYASQSALGLPRPFSETRNFWESRHRPTTGESHPHVNYVPYNTMCEMRRVRKRLKIIYISIKAGMDMTRRWTWCCSIVAGAHCGLWHSSWLSPAGECAYERLLRHGPFVWRWREVSSYMVGRVLLWFHILYYTGGREQIKVHWIVVDTQLYIFGSSRVNFSFRARGNFVNGLGEWVISKFNSTPTPKGSYSAKTGVNCPMSPNRVHQKCMPWSNECKVQDKTSIGKKSSNEQGNAHYGPRPAKVAG